MNPISTVAVAWDVWAWFALAGVYSGFLSGLLGIGGAFVLVPSFLAIFHFYYHFDNNFAVPLALGTTMACMVVNAVCSTLAQHRRCSVAWEVLIDCWPLLCLGTAMGVFLASRIPAVVVQAAFAANCIYSGLRMTLGNSHSARPPQGSASRPTIFLFSASCGLLGTGGANLFVPYFMRSMGLDLRKAMGTASAFQIPVSIVGTVGFVAAGLIGVLVRGDAGAIRFVFVPAWLLVSIVSPYFNHLGVVMAHRLAARRLKALFGTFTLLVGLKMLHGALA